MSTLEDVGKKVTENIRRIMKTGAQYTDARWYQDDSSEMFIILDGNLEANDTMLRAASASGTPRRAWVRRHQPAWHIDECFDRAHANAVPPLNWSR